MHLKKTYLNGNVHFCFRTHVVSLSEFLNELCNVKRILSNGNLVTDYFYNYYKENQISGRMLLECVSMCMKMFALMLVILLLVWKGFI